MPTIYPVALPPVLEQAKQCTDVLQIINGFENASRRYSEIRAENLSCRILEQQWLANNQRPMRQMLCHPPDAVGMDWTQVPPDLCSLVNEIAKITGWLNFPILLAILGNLNSAMWGRYQVQIRQEWLEPVILYLLLMAPSGKNKSLVYRLLTQVIENYQQQLLDKYSTEVNAVCNLRRVMQQAKNVAQTAAIKAALREARNDASGVDLHHFFNTIRESAEEMAFAADTEIEQLVPPFLLADGFTEKKLLRRMAACGGGQSIIQPEVATFIAHIKNPRFDPKILLKSYGMENFTDSTVPYGDQHLQNPFLTMLLYGQPGIAAPIYSSQRLIDSGFTARIAPFFSMHANEPSTTPEQIVSNNLRNYEQKITVMLKRNFTQIMKRDISTIQLSPEARREIELYHRELKETVLPSCSDGLESFVEKLAGTATRIAGVLHAWQCDEPEQYYMSQQTALAGIAIARVILPHARYAFSTSGFRAFTDAQKILKWVKRHQQAAFTSKDIAQYSGVRTNEKIHPALDLLEQHNILTQRVTAQKPRLCLMHQSFHLNL